jgi:hypothetical protein
MDFAPLPFRAGLDDYEKQADDLLDAWRAGDAGAIRIVRQKHRAF